MQYTLTYAIIRTMKHFQVRIPDHEHNLISEAAKQNGRSVQAEYLSRLMDSLGHADTDTRLKAIESGIKEIKQMLEQRSITK